MRYQRPKGTADILPGESERWAYVENVARRVFAKYRFDEIRTPMFESFDVFSRTSGETSDVVTKEMYDFMDKGDRHLSLRPEGTAGVVRAFVENKLYGQMCLSRLKSIIWDPCSDTNGPNLDGCVNFTKLVSRPLAQTSRRLTWKPLRWEWTY